MNYLSFLYHAFCLLKEEYSNIFLFFMIHIVQNDFLPFIDELLTEQKEKVQRVDR